MTNIPKAPGCIGKAPADEPVGITKYEGKGAPGGFDKLKVRIGKDNQAITVRLYKML